MVIAGVRSAAVVSCERSGGGLLRRITPHGPFRPGSPPVRRSPYASAMLLLYLPCRHSSSALFHCRTPSTAPATAHLWLSPTLDTQRSPALSALLRRPPELAPADASLLLLNLLPCSPIRCLVARTSQRSSCTMAAVGAPFLGVLPPTPTAFNPPCPLPQSRSYLCPQDPSSHSQ